MPMLPPMVLACQLASVVNLRCMTVCSHNSNRLHPIFSSQFICYAAFQFRSAVQSRNRTFLHAVRIIFHFSITINTSSSSVSELFRIVSSQSLVFDSNPKLLNFILLFDSLRYALHQSTSCCRILSSRRVR